MAFREVLEEKRVDLVDRIKAIRQSLTELTGDLEVKEAQLRNVEELIRLETLPPDTVRAAALDGVPEKSLMDSVADLLKETDRPMHYQAITQRLVANGLHVPGRNPAANLLTQMTRDARFRKTARGTYALTPEPGRKEPRP